MVASIGIEWVYSEKSFIRAKFKSGSKILGLNLHHWLMIQLYDFNCSRTKFETVIVNVLVFLCKNFA